MKKISQNRLLLIFIPLIFAIICVVAFFLLRNNDDGLSATTMRLLRFNGEVGLLDAGVAVTPRENMLLHSGNGVSTEADSYVDINLDDTKTAGLDELSDANFEQNGKKLHISLNTGGVYFYTTKELDDYESFDIETNTMMVGIRGTSGYVSYDEDSGESTLMLTSGEVHIIATNPKTNATKETDVSAGQQIHTYFNDDKSGEESILFSITQLDEASLPEFFVERLAENKDVFDRVIVESGLDKDVLSAIARSANTIERVTETAEDDSTEDNAPASQEPEEIDNTNDNTQTEDVQRVTANNTQGSTQNNSTRDNTTRSSLPSTTDRSRSNPTVNSNTSTPASTSSQSTLSQSIMPSQSAVASSQSASSPTGGSTAGSSEADNPSSGTSTPSDVSGSQEDTSSTDDGGSSSSDGSTSNDDGSSDDYKVLLDRYDSRLSIPNELFLVLHASVDPTDADTSDKEIVWSSSDEAVATVLPVEGQNLTGNVTAVAAGTATITVSVGDVRAECTVAVTDTRGTGSGDGSGNDPDGSDSGDVNEHGYGAGLSGTSSIGSSVRMSSGKMALAALKKSDTDVNVEVSQIANGATQSIIVEDNPATIKEDETVKIQTDIATPGTNGSEMKIITDEADIPEGEDMSEDDDEDEDDDMTPDEDTVQDEASESQDEPMD